MYRDPPAGLTLEQWWGALKFHRRMQYKTLPLKDKRAQQFQYMLADPVFEHLHRIDQNAAGRIEMLSQVTDKETRDRYYVSSLLEEAVTSSQIEGAATTRKVAKDMIRSGRRPANRGEQMVLNNYRTMERIGELLDEELTPELVRDIQRAVTVDTLDDPADAGRFRRDDVHIVDEVGNPLYTPPPASELPERVQAMCDFANEKTPSGFLHPVIRSIILHFWLAYDHPFADGNGRTARALFYWSMRRYKYWLFEFISISQIILRARSQYGQTFLRVEMDDNDLTYFILYHLDVMDRALDQLNKYLARKARETEEAGRLLRGQGELNHRQRALLSHALRHPNHRYTFRSHQTSHNIVYQTARTDLLQLEAMGLLLSEKVGRTYYFTPTPDLTDHLCRKT